jgi:DNA-binding transcriptional MerR regulator
MTKDPDAYRTISEVAETLDVPAHVLRFWETKFPQIRPLKRGGGRRFYRRADVDLLRAVRRLLYDDAYTIRGVQRLLKSRGTAAVTGLEVGALAPEAGHGADGGPATAADLENVRPRVLLERLAADIAACRAILDAAGRTPMAQEPGPEAIRPPPAAADPAVPASAAPPP